MFTILKKELDLLDKDDFHNLYFYNPRIKKFKLVDSVFGFKIETLAGGLLKDNYILVNPRSSVGVPDDLSIHYASNVDLINIEKWDFPSLKCKTFKEDLYGFLDFLTYMKEGKDLELDLVEIPFFSYDGWLLVNAFVEGKINKEQFMSMVPNLYMLATIVLNDSLINNENLLRTMCLQEFYSDNGLGLYYCVDLMVYLSQLSRLDLKDLINPNMIKYLDHVFRNGYCYCCGDLRDGIEEIISNNGLIAKLKLSDSTLEIMREEMITFSRTEETINKSFGMKNLIYLSYLHGVVVDDEWVNKTFKDEKVSNVICGNPSNLFKLMLINLNMG